MLIEFDQVGVTLQERQVLHDITLSLRERRIGVVGPNGSGKSTLARLCNGLVLPDPGRVCVDGLDTRSSARAVRRKVGFVFQNPDNQIVFPVVNEDLAFGLKNQGLARDESARRVTAQLEAFGIGHLAPRASHLLSGGEKQLVAMASVLVMRPELVVFDEPTTLLDLRNRNRIRAAIAALEPAAIVVTHDLALLEDFDRVLVVLDGRIACDARPAEALAWYTAHCA